MTSDQRIVWGAISGCRGKAMAVTQHQLAIVCDMPPRRVRQVIAELIFAHRKRIGCAYCHPGGGYYVIESEAEARETTEKMRGHAVKILQRAAVIERLSVRDLMQKIQMELDL